MVAVDTGQVAGVQFAERVLGKIGEVTTGQPGPAQHEFAVIDPGRDTRHKASEPVPTGRVGARPEFRNSVGDRHRKDLGHPVDGAYGGVRKARVHPLQQRTQYGCTTHHDGLQASRAQPGRIIQRAQHRIHHRGHHEDQFGIAQQPQVVLGTRAGVGARRWDRPVRARDECRHAHHQLVGEHPLARPHAHAVGEIRQSGPQ